MSNELHDNLKSLISLPVSTRIILKTTTAASRIYEVQREAKTEVTVLNLETNDTEYMKKSVLFDFHQDGRASFIYPNESWEATLDANKRSITEAMRALPEAEQFSVRLRQEMMKQMHAAANPKGRVPRAYVEKISKEARASHPTVKGLSRSSLYALYREWLRSGGHIAAVLPHSSSKGNRWARFDKAVLEAFNKVLKDHYLKRHAPLASEVYEAFTIEINRINKTRAEPHKLKKPSLDTFRRWIRKLNRFEVALQRHGEAVARKMHGYSAALDQTRHPLDIVEVDHTPIDLQLISEITGIPCGRAWLTLMVDVNSRVVPGIHISFDPPSYVSVAKALEHAIKVKPKYPGTKNDWPCHGKPVRLRVDNGPEFHSTDFENSCAALGIIIEYTPRRKPWRKPHVERLFRDIANLFHSMPSSTFSNYIKKGDFNPDKNAYATIEAVTKALIRWVVDVYHQKPHGGLGDIPIRRYLAGIKEFPVSLPSSMTDLAIALGQREERLLHDYGIEFRGEIFKGEVIASIRSHPDYRAKQRHEIRYLDSDCTRIQVKHPDGRYVELQNVKAELYAGMNFYQMRLLRLHAQFELHREADWDGIAAAKEDIRRTLGFYDTKRKRHLSRKETRMTPGLADDGCETPPPVAAPADPQRAMPANPVAVDPLAHRSDSEAWGSHYTNTDKGDN